MSCIAGPSRIPFNSIRVLPRLSSSLHTSAPRSAEVTAAEQDEKEVQATMRAEKQFWADRKGYERWRSNFGRDYERVQSGQRAKWMGGNVVGLSQYRLG